MRKNHLIDLCDLTREQWEEIVDLAVQISQNPSAYAEAGKGKILATLFYEPSTRTKMSFQTAMFRLGGNVIGFDNPQTSSVSKGESLADTLKIVSGYVDVIAMRHSIEGAVLAAAQAADCPVINAGDGGHLHPTQTLTDLVTLRIELGDLNHRVIGICGDLKNGRTVHSLINTLCHYQDIEFVLISTPELLLPARFKEVIHRSGCRYREVLSIEEAIAELDVLYMTRIQKERFTSLELYNQQKNVYVLNSAKLCLAKPELKILHPLPRVDEIEPSVDTDPRALYFKQARYGVFARMALILTLLSSQNKEAVLHGNTAGDTRCPNPNCITNLEEGTPLSVIREGDQSYCEYCDSPLKD